MSIWPDSLVLARGLVIAMAPVQWGIALRYFLYWNSLPKYSARRLLAWAFTFALNIVVPVGFYRLNAVARHPDWLVSLVVFIDGIVFIVLVFWMIRKRPRGHETLGH